MPDDIQVLINGGLLDGMLEYTSHHGMDKATGTCDIKISPSPNVQMPVKLGDKIVCIVAGRPVLTGHVHEVDGDDEWNHDHRTFHARDKTQDAIDSTVGPQKAPKPPVGLADVMRQTLGGMGLGSIGVIDNINPEKFEQGEVPSGGIEEHGHAFFDRLARQRQVLLGTDGKGNYTIDRNTGKRGSGFLWRAAPDDPRSSLNNIIKAKYRNTDLNRHNQHSVSSQHSTNDKDYWEGKPKGFQPAQAGPLSKEYGIGYDDDVRQERRKHTRASHSLQRGRTKGAAAWRSNVAKARGFQYIATVAGLTQSPVPGADFGEPWWPGLIIPVYDYKYEIESDLLIVDVKFHKTWPGGTVTELTFSYPDSYSSKDGKSSAKGGRTASQGAGDPDSQGDAPDSLGLESEEG